MTATNTVVSGMTFELDGLASPLTLKPFVAKASGNTWYCLSKKGRSAPYGIQGPAATATLPDVALVHGVPVVLEPGFTKKSGNPKTSGTTRITLDGVILNVTVQVSLLPDGRWNIIAKANRPGGGGSAVDSWDELE